MDNKKLFLTVTAILLIVVGWRFSGSVDSELMSAQLFRQIKIPKVQFNGVKVPSGNLSINSSDNLVHKFKVTGDKKQDLILYEMNVFVQFGNGLISLEKPAIKEIKIYDQGGQLVGSSSNPIPEFTGAGMVFPVETEVYLGKKDKLTFLVEADIESIDSDRVLLGASFWINMSPQDVSWKTLDGELWGTADGSIRQPRSGLFNIVN